MDFHDRERRGALLAGAVLVIVGIAVFGVQLTGFEVGWPDWVIIPGVAIFLVALAIGGPSGAGFAALGGIVTSVGAILAIQDATHAYASWAYAWALVAPGGVGGGLFLYGLLTMQWDTARGGLGALIAGLAIFLAGFVFFEGLIGLDGRPSADVAKVIAPAALVALGALVILGAFLPGPWRSSRSRWDRAASPAGAGGWSDAAPSSGASGFTDAAPSSGPSTPPPSGSATGAAADAVDPDVRAIDLAGVQSGEVSIAFGAGQLAIVGPAGPGRLVDGVFRGGVERQDRGPGAVRLSTPGDAFWERVWSGSAPFDWRLGLSAEVPLRLALEVGAARTEADLSALRVTDVRLKTGASETRLTLPASAGYTRAEIEAGAASVRVTVPAGVAARIRSTVAIGSTSVDTARFPRDPLGGWASTDYGTAANRVDIEVRGGVGAVAIV